MNDTEYQIPLHVACFKLNNFLSIKENIFLKLPFNLHLRFFVV